MPGTLVMIFCLLCVMPLATPAVQAEDKATPAAAPVPLNPKETILLDKPHGKLLLKAQVVLREGLLEMFLCPKQTKEHEAIVSLDGKMHIIHAGLLALGAEPGSPVQFRPEYTPPRGPKIDIYVNWKDEEGKPQRMKAQQWIRRATHRYFEAPLAKVPEGVVLNEGDDSLRYDTMNSVLLWFGSMTDEKKQELLKMSEDEAYRKAVISLHDQGQYREMQADFVFVGSAFRKLEDGTELYLAEAGSGICVANFPDAMIDINQESSASEAEGLLFEPYTERIPPVGTEVTVELIPVAPDSDD
jgi:hypothetical protein